jgi:hypothetical protein
MNNHPTPTATRSTLPLEGRVSESERWAVWTDYFSPTLNGGSLPGGVVSSAIARIMATMT